MVGSFVASRWKQCPESVDSRASIQETGANVNRESVVPTIFSSQSKGKRDRDQQVAHSLRQKFSNISLNVKLTRPSEEREWLSKHYMKLRQTLRRKIGIREILTSFCQEINQEFESQRFQLHQAKTDLAQRDEISMYRQLKLRNWLFQEDHARDCQEIEELRRICCKETDRARRARFD